MIFQLNMDGICFSECEDRKRLFLLAFLPVESLDVYLLSSVSLAVSGKPFPLLNPVPLSAIPGALSGFSFCTSEPGLYLLPLDSLLSEPLLQPLFLRLL